MTLIYLQIHTSKLQVKGCLKNGKISFLPDFYLKHFLTFLGCPHNLKTSNYTEKHSIGWTNLTYSYKESLAYFSKCLKKVLVDQHFSLSLLISSGYT